MSVRTQLNAVIGVLTHTDRLVGMLLPYLVIIVLVCFAVFFYLMGSSLTLNIIMESAGVIAGIVAVYFIYHSLGQEKNIQFFDGEQVILKSQDNKTYAAITALGENDLPLAPIKANVYLTNLGIMAEPQGSGEVAIFIPLDRITDFAPHQNGIRIRYIDAQYPFAEALFVVDDRNTWMQTLSNILNRGLY